MLQNTLSSPCGVLVVDKPEGITSHDVVGRVRRLYNTKQVGHTGTLDPMATGVLVLLVGRAAKAAEYIASDEKGYEAVLRLGIATDTDDVTGKIIAASDALPDEAEVLHALTFFRGKIPQVPPMYSALKVGGQKLCDLARKGIEIERDARNITVFTLNAQRIDRANYALSVECSKGTYIRALCRDIGARLGCGGTMAALRRTMAGRYTLSDSAVLAAVEAAAPEDRAALLRPLESLFYDLPELRPDDFYVRRLRSGAAVLTGRLGFGAANVGKRFRLCDADGFFALGEIIGTTDGDAIKSVKMFDAQKA